MGRCGEGEVDGNPARGRGNLSCRDTSPVPLKLSHGHLRSLGRAGRAALRERRSSRERKDFRSWRRMSWSEAHSMSASGNACHGRRLGILARHLCSGPAEPGAFSDPEQSHPVIVGAMVLDIHACPASGEITAGTTIPGEVRFVRGGVGRNVAECLSKLATPPFLISVVGDDVAGELLIAHWRSLGLSTDGIRRCSGAATPVVASVFDGGGEVAAAVADVHAVEAHLTTDWIKGFAKRIRAAPVVLLDANLSPAALATACKLANDAGAPVWFEPVSVAKSVRATDILKSITFASPNEAEVVAMAEALVGRVELSSREERASEADDGDHGGLEPRVWAAVREVLRAGVQRVVLTRGGRGAALCWALEEPWGFSCRRFEALPAAVVARLSGAGDCLVAGAMAGLCRKLPVPDVVACGMAAARLAVESPENIPLRLSWPEIALGTTFDPKNVSHSPPISAPGEIEPF